MTDDNRPEEQEPVVWEFPDSSAGFLLAERAAYHMLMLKADDIVVLDLRGLSDVCDFFVIGTGHAGVQVSAIAREVTDGLHAWGQKPVGAEGLNEGRWALLDFVDVVVHVLKPEVREYYQLERLWSDAGVLAIDEQHVTGDGFRQRHPDLAPPVVEAPSSEVS